MRELTNLFICYPSHQFNSKQILIIVKIQFNSFLNQVIHSLNMLQSQYSPYLYNYQQQTNQKQTTSFKKYPANKYFDNLDQENDDIKSKLFIHQNPQYHFFMNDKVNQMVKINSTHTQQSTKNSHNPKSRPIISKNVQTNNDHRRIQRAKSCTAYKAKIKKSLNSKQKITNEQKDQQLLMYKQLCLSLRKQKQTLSSQLQKHQKRQNKFSSQIADLKQKIKKLYDHCIEKNKSSKNIDANFIELLKNHMGDLKSAKNCKENNSFMINSKSQLKNKLKTKTQMKTNHQTLDTTKRTSRHELNVSSSFLKGQKRNYDKKSSKKTTMNSVETERRKSKNYKYPQPSQFPKYDTSQLTDNQPSTVVSTTRPNSQKKQQNIYREFFSTFVKSLEIFERESSVDHKTKNKLFKDGGYYVQWAKQEWFEIVQYLIKKGYVSGCSQKSKQKSLNSSVNESRRCR